MHQDLQEIRKKRGFEAGIILYIIVTILLAFVSNSSLVVIFIATLPILLSLASFIALIEFNFIDMKITFALPLLFSAIFYAVWRTGATATLRKMDGGVLAILDIFATYIIFALIIMIWGNKIPHTRVKTKVKEIIVNQDNNQSKNVDPLLEKKYLDLIAKTKEEKEYYKELAKDYETELAEVQKYHVNVEDYDYDTHIHKYIKELMGQIKKYSKEAKDTSAQDKFDKKKELYVDKIKSLREELKIAKQALEITKENFAVSLRSIEDKCKGINFVVGRVYADKKGGNSNIRELLNINRVLYNAFSELTKNWNDEDVTSQKVKMLMQILWLLKRKLELFLVPEKVLFTVDKGLLPVDRDKSGSDIVLDVLEKNDKDPIKEYHAEASEVCIKVISFLKKNY